ncbi:unnamed protein product, partial [Staurois parvus]
SVASAVPPVSVHQCLVSVLFSASCQCPSVPHQCHISVPTSAHLSCLSVSPISAAYQCLPISDACQCLSVSISAAYRCPSLQPH